MAFGTDWFGRDPRPARGPLRGGDPRASRRAGPPAGWFPEEKLSLDEALDLYTRGSAYAEFAEASKGTLAPGKLADLVVFDEGPLPRGAAGDPEHARRHDRRRRPRRLRAVTPARARSSSAASRRASVTLRRPRRSSTGRSPTRAAPTRRSRERRTTTSRSSSSATPCSASSSQTFSTSATPTGTRGRRARCGPTSSRPPASRSGPSPWGCPTSSSWGAGRRRPAGGRRPRSGPTPTRPSSPRSTWTAAWRPPARFVRPGVRR